MKNPFTALFRARDKPRDSVSAAPVFYFGTSGAGKSVTAQTAIQLSTVYACVRVISETVASLPLGVYEATDDGNLKAGDHPLYHLLHDEPNAEMTSFVFREVMKNGWRMKEIDEMDMLGFLRLRAWDATREQEKKKPRQRFIDEVWPGVKP